MSDMKISLTTQELRKILKEKYGEAHFEIFYHESNEEWQQRTGLKITGFKSREELEREAPYIKANIRISTYDRY